MTYSVYNPATRLYTYYETSPSLGDVETPSPKHLRRGNQIGISPEEAAWLLPANARRTGQGQFARGMIARTGGALGLGDVPTGAVGAVGLGLAAWLLWEACR